MITFTFLRQYLAVLEQRGVKPSEVLARADITPRLLEDPNSRVSAEEHDRFWRYMLSTYADEVLALKKADTLAPASLSSLVYLAMSCESGLEAMASLVQYKSEGSDIAIEFCVDDKETIFSISPEVSQLEYANYFFCLAAQHVIDLLAWLSKKTINPTSIRISESLRVPEFSFLKDYAALLSSESELVSEKPVLSFKTADLKFPLAGSNALLKKTLERAAQLELEKFKPDPSFTNAVEIHLTSCFVALEQDKELEKFNAEISLEKVASYFCMTGRTLQRKLKAEGITFSSLVDKVRLIQIKYFQDGNLTLDEIAELTGFSDAVSVGRFIKRLSQ